MTPDADSRCLGLAFQGWLAYIQQRDCQVFLYNPVSGYFRIKIKINLPSVETLPVVKGVFQNGQSGLVEGFIDYFSPQPVNPQDYSDDIIKKVVLS